MHQALVFYVVLLAVRVRMHSDSFASNTRCWSINEYKDILLAGGRLVLEENLDKVVRST